MSEPVSSDEIEDVLVSIRRLVADGPEAAPAGKTEPSAAQMRPEKLVLTPALRVLDGADGTDGAAGEEGATEPSAPAAPAREPLCDEPEIAGGAASGSSTRELERKIAELEAVVSASGGDWEPDGSEAEEISPILLNRTVAQEPAGRVAGIVLEAEEEPDEEPDEAAEEAAEESGASENEAILDEEALRALVAELVREQLRGEIGVRITRSIRRLVRREIKLALSLREVE